MGNGYSVNAVAVRVSVAEELMEGRFPYVQWHQNCPLGYATTKEMMAFFQKKRWWKEAKS